MTGVFVLVLRMPFLLGPVVLSALQRLEPACLCRIIFKEILGFVAGGLQTSYTGTHSNWKTMPHKTVQKFKIWASFPPPRVHLSNGLQGLGMFVSKHVTADMHRFTVVVQGALQVPWHRMVWCLDDFAAA